MKIVVDLAVCQGYAQCAFLAPDAFRIYGEEALLYDPQPDDELRERVVQAAAACPVQAISVERPIGPRRYAPRTGTDGSSTGRPDSSGMRTPMVPPASAAAGSAGTSSAVTSSPGTA